MHAAPPCGWHTSGSCFHLHSPATHPHQHSTVLFHSLIASLSLSILPARLLLWSPDSKMNSLSTNLYLLSAVSNHQISGSVPASSSLMSPAQPHGHSQLVYKLSFTFLDVTALHMLLHSSADWLMRPNVSHELQTHDRKCATAYGILPKIFFVLCAG